eukprot:CAMPEP_0170325010 /NCGR_PEP_ID=MMETSP0116_2-20130129/63362_1 /TAXON_ID=400756 /ORGANISM="Durinskia baltica, Strain CSIRO CS-38" /LENGTH=131 /DNA_ID=CAMNT_0010578027 /DNA_START=72 /DNA_END=464 /DNA_ORIENTATION=+
MAPPPAQKSSRAPPRRRHKGPRPPSTPLEAQIFSRKRTAKGAAPKQASSSRQATPAAPPAPASRQSTRSLGKSSNNFQGLSAALAGRGPIAKEDVLESVGERRALVAREGERRLAQGHKVAQSGVAREPAN